MAAAIALEEDYINQPDIEEKVKIIREKKRLEHHHSGGHHHHNASIGLELGIGGLDEVTDPIDVDSFLNDPS